jgi:hypothetical protein
MITSGSIRPVKDAKKDGFFLGLQAVIVIG